MFANRMHTNSVAPIATVTFTGAPRKLGLAHGQAFTADIRHFAAERVQLAQDPLYTGRTLSRGAVMAIAEACVAAHEAYSADLVDEMRGMADATGLSLAEVLIVGGFTDFVDTASAVGGDFSRAGRPMPASRFVDDCTAFIIPDGSAGGAGFLGQTWDMHASAAEHVFLMHIVPDHGPRAVIFTSQGCLGMIGMNEAGLAVGINNLSGADGQIGVTWPLVIREMLRQTSADGALDCIQRAPLAGAHNYLIMDAAGAGYNVEAMSSCLGISPLDDGPLVHTNHCLLETTQDMERDRLPAQVAASELRLNVARTLLTDPDLGAGEITVEDLMALTREPDAICVRPVAPKYVATCGAVIMRPRTRELWAVAGPPTQGEFRRLVVC